MTDSWNHHIQKLTTEGQSITSVGIEGIGPLKFDFPRGITFNPTNSKVYVVDNNHCVQVLNSDLTFSSSFGKRGSGEGHCIEPHDVRSL